MSKENQIGEMAKIICRLGNSCQDCYLYPDDCKAVKYAERFYTAGYRKQSEVAMELFDEFEQIIDACEYSENFVFPKVSRTRYNGERIAEMLAELKNKYAEHKT